MGVRLVLDAARGHVKGIRLHRVARELLVEVRIKIPRPRLEHEPRGPAFHQESSRLRERDEVAARVEQLRGVPYYSRALQGSQIYSGPFPARGTTRSRRESQTKRRR